MSPKLPAKDGDSGRHSLDSRRTRRNTPNQRYSQRVIISPYARYGNTPEALLLVQFRSPQKQKMEDACLAYKVATRCPKNERNYSRAIQLFKEVDEAKSYFNIGQIYLSQSEYENAVEAFSTAIEKDKYLAVAYIQRGFAYFAQEQWDEARVDYELARTMGIERGKSGSALGEPLSRSPPHAKKIGCHQMGLNFVLYNCQTLFNEGLCLFILSKQKKTPLLRHIALDKFYEASRQCERSTNKNKDHSRIEAVRKSVDMKDLPEPFMVKFDELFESQPLVVKAPVPPQKDIPAAPDNIDMEPAKSTFLLKARNSIANRFKPTPVQSTSEPLPRSSLGTYPPPRPSKSETYANTSQSMRTSSLSASSNRISARSQYSLARASNPITEDDLQKDPWKNNLPEIPHVADPFAQFFLENPQYSQRSTPDQRKSAPSPPRARVVPLVTPPVRRSVPSSKQIPPQRPLPPTPPQELVSPNPEASNDTDHSEDPSPTDATTQMEHQEEASLTQAIQFQVPGTPSSPCHYPVPLAPWEADPHAPVDQVLPVAQPLPEAKLFVVKIHYKDTYRIRVQRNVTFTALADKVRKTCKLPADKHIIIRYKDDDDMVMMVDDEDLSRVLDDMDYRGDMKLVLWCEDPPMSAEKTSISASEPSSV